MCHQCTQRLGFILVSIRDEIMSPTFLQDELDAHDSGEYYREPGLSDTQARGVYCLTDTELPTGLSPEEEREACRALKGAMLRQEVYALDRTA